MLVTPRFKIWKEWADTYKRSRSISSLVEPVTWTAVDHWNVIPSLTLKLKVNEHVRTAQILVTSIDLTSLKPVVLNELDLSLKASSLLSGLLLAGLADGGRESTFVLFQIDWLWRDKYAAGLDMGLEPLALDDGLLVSLLHLDRN